MWANQNILKRVCVCACLFVCACVCVCERKRNEKGPDGRKIKVEWKVGGGEKGG